MKNSSVGKIQDSMSYRREKLSEKKPLGQWVRFFSVLIGEMRCLNFLTCYSWCSNQAKSIFLINIMSLEVMNNSLSFRLRQGLEDRLNSWVPQQILLSYFCVPTMHSESIAPNMKQSAWELFVRNFFFLEMFAFLGGFLHFRDDQEEKIVTTFLTADFNLKTPDILTPKLTGLAQTL